MTAFDAALIFFAGCALGWLLATVGYGRALQRVAKLYRDQFDAQMKDVKFRLQMLESLRGIDDARVHSRSMKP